MQLIKQFQQTIDIQNYSQQTKKAYRFHIEKFINFCNNNPLQELILPYLEDLANKKHYKSSSLNLAKYSLSYFFKSLNQEIYVKIPLIKRDKLLPKTLEKIQIKKLIENIKNLKHRCLVEIAYSSGLRPEGADGDTSDSVSTNISIGTTLGDDDIKSASATGEEYSPTTLTHSGTKITYYIRLYSFDNHNFANLSDYLDFQFNLTNLRPNGTAEINKTIAYTNYTLGCNYTFSDDDGDNENTTIRGYKWYVDGIENTTFENSSVLNQTAFFKNNATICSVLVFDKYELSDTDWRNSTSLTINNSIPYPENLAINKTPAETTDDLEGNWTRVTDQDNDTITESYRWYLNRTLTGNLTKTLGDG